MVNLKTKIGKSREQSANKGAIVDNFILSKELKERLDRALKQATTENGGSVAQTNFSSKIIQNMLLEESEE